MGTTIADYSTSHPSPAALIAAGFSGVMRYLSHDPAKNLTPAERDSLFARGLCIGLVWETTAGRAGQGTGAGIADVRDAETQADALGFPLDVPIFYAVDYAASPVAVAGYFSGVASAARRPVGVYGSAGVVEGVACPWKWQTSAWSAQRISPQAHLYQRGTTSPLPGTDINDVHRPVPMWTGALGGSGGSTSVILTPGGAAAPPAPPAQLEDDMMLHLDTNGTGYLVNDFGVAGLTAQEFNLIQRMKNMNAAGAAYDTDPFLPGEMGIINGVLQRLRGTGQPAPAPASVASVDVAAIAQAVNDDAATRRASWR